MVKVMKYLYYFQVIFFKPKVPMDGQYNTLISNYGVAATPNIEAAFYTVAFGGLHVSVATEGMTF